jgi:hypothetical protein
MRQLVAQYDPEIGTLCIECYNNSLIEKTNELKNKLDGFTKFIGDSKINKNEEKKEEV